MPTGPLTRTLVVAGATVRGTLRSGGALGLLGAALLFPVLLGGIAAGNFPGLDLLGAAESLFSGLFLPVVVLLVCLVQGVALFRTELEEDTLLYPLKRTVPRPSLVAGKYLGFVATTLLALLPSAFLGFAVAAVAGHGPTDWTAGLGEAVFLLTTLAVVAYGATFLLLGLLTRSALVIGLVYGFLWETFVSLLPGPIGQWTVVHYLRAAGAALDPAGSLQGGSAAGNVASITVGLGLFSLASLGLASLVLRYTESRAGAAPT